MVTFLNIISGKVYELEEADLQTTQSYEVPLLKPLDKNCKKCNGRGHVGFNIRTQHHSVCPTCSRKNVNHQLYQALSAYRKQKAEFFKRAIEHIKASIARSIQQQRGQ